MVSDADVKSTLEEILNLSMSAAGVDDARLRVKHMGMVKRTAHLKYSWYLQIQNFDQLSIAKKSKGKNVFRFKFRSMFLKNQDAHFLEVVKWTPEIGPSVDDTIQLLYGQKDLVANSFRMMMVDALLLSVRDRQDF